MEVIAIDMGFFKGRRVRAGVKFEVPEGSKGKWYTPTGTVKAEPPKGGTAEEVIASLPDQDIEGLTALMTAELARGSKARVTVVNALHAELEVKKAAADAAAEAAAKAAAAAGDTNQLV